MYSNNIYYDKVNWLKNKNEYEIIDYIWRCSLSDNYPHEDSYWIEYKG